MECIYNLMTFGIPAENMPVSFSGDRRLEAHQDFCKRIRSFSTLSGDPEKFIVLPSTYDVLLGRGKPIQKHPGNLRYHQVVGSYQGAYEEMHKLAKTDLSKTIVEQFKDAGHRFLKQEEYGWVEVDDEAARNKVSHAFRNHRIAARVQERKPIESENRRKFNLSAEEGGNGGNGTTNDSDTSVSYCDGQKRQRTSSKSRSSG